ncbi:MAG TPA: peptidylprolyl isomerase [Thermohalobaculum sp.]|nr:peptidylprolyl isomerase [Thermohalobaculum sp.]
MSDRPDIPRLKQDRPRPEPVMPSACQSGGCGGPAPRRPPPPSFSEVRVNGVEIDRQAIAQEIQHHPAPDAQAAWTEAARALVIRELLLQEAQRLGIEGESEPDEAGRSESDDDAVIAALLDREVEPEVPGLEECRRYYEARRERFRTPDLFEVAHVLIEPEGKDEDAWAAAEAQARTIIEEVGCDPRAFAAVARELSACPSAAQEGSLGQVRRGELVPEVQAAIERLEPGTVEPEPVRSRFGWHVIRLARRIEGHTLPFEAVQEKIAEMFAARGWSVAATRYVAALAERAELEGVALDPAVL